MYRVLLLIACLALSLPQLAPASWPQRLQDQRTAFRDAWPRALDGDASSIRQNQLLLVDYPLYPDLQAAWLKSQIGKIKDAEIDEFLSDHQGSSAIRDLRYHWAKSLGARGHWIKYLELYNSQYANTDDETLVCLALTARLRTDSDDTFAADALAYWLNGDSRATECDPPFDWLSDQDLIQDEHRRKRIALALDNRKFELAAWLAKPMEKTDQDRVQNWRRMRHRPADALAQPLDLSDTEENRTLIMYGVMRLARYDLNAANAAWSGIAHVFSFDDVQRRAVVRSLTMTAVRDYQPEAYHQIFSLERSMIDDDMLEWGVRAALRNGDWQSILQAIAAMSNDNKRQAVWQYWRARALEARGDSDQAIGIYTALAQSRDYYGFLAADRLAISYQFNHVPAAPDEAMLEQLELRNGMIRAREMFFVDLHGKGRSEWDRDIDEMSRAEKAQSAILASRWGWHSRAIATAARAGLRDDLLLSYPMAFRDLFESNTTELGLPMTWAYGIARSESLFMPDVTSTAGALGVMQVTPATGRMTARQVKMRYYGSHMLLDPVSNIALGTFYLDRMYARFDDHQVLATAAYNAGPHRVARWLPEDKPMAADIWVDTVPYRETRQYLRRVLAADVIFHWRMTGEMRRLAAVMPPVPIGAN